MSFSFSNDYVSLIGCHDLIIGSILNTRLLVLPFINKKKELSFKANTVCLLEDWLKERNQDLHMNVIGCLSSQIQYLENHGLSFLGFGLKDIIVVDDHSFFIVNDEYLMSFDKDNLMIPIMNPFVKPMFSSPEVIELSKLPGKIFVDSCYYSLGALVVFCLFDIYLFKGNEIKNEKEIEAVLKPIALTKMYWFLKRCFTKKGKRRLLYV